MELLRLADAAHEVSISYPTLKQWIYRGKIRSVKTPGGHHRIPRSEIDRLTRARTGRRRRPKGLEAISGRNKLLGTVTDLQIEGLLAQVTLDIGGQTITSIITRRATEELGLKKGMSAFALVKATEVMIIRG
ncbi:MAG TPA: TOBE domain-containing protein [Terriglobia bacterium]|jgi:molybdopterin-binding protein